MTSTLSDIRHIILIIGCLAFLSAKTVSGQPMFSVSEGYVSITDEALLNVDGDVYLDVNTVIFNEDTIRNQGDWINESNGLAFDPSLTGYVYLDGDDQTITGSSITRFHNLFLENNGTKYATINVEVDSLLDIGDRQFDLDTNTIFVFNTESNVVNRNQGFIRALGNGGIERTLNSTNRYVFPVGFELGGDTFYRPVDIVPNLSGSYIYRVRLVENDPNLDNLDREERDLLICSINAKFYHKIWEELGTDSVAIDFTFNPLEDGEFNDIVHWRNPPQWEIAPSFSSTDFSANKRVIRMYPWKDYLSENFALSETTGPFAQAGNDTTIYLLDTAYLSASGGIDYTWTPADYLSCDNCPDPIFFHDSTTSYVVLVQNDRSCKDIDSITIFVDDRFDEDPFIPNGLTMNGDGLNDFWYIRWLYQFPDNSVSIVNRWGDVVYNAAPYNNDWRGTWKGQQLPAGTYYYILNLNQSGQTQQTYTGHITLVE